MPLKYLRFLSLTIAFFIAVKVNSQIPISPQKKSILLIGGYAHIGNGKVIEESAIGIKEGKISMVANTYTTPYDSTKFDTIIYIKGKHVYPGFIAPNSTIGLTEIESVRATLDFSETGSINPNVRSLIAYNTDSKIIPTVRTNGVLIAQVAPRRGLIPGTSSIVELNGWNWEDAVLKEDDGIFMNWPETFSAGGWWAEPGPNQKNKEKEKHVQDLEAFFRDAKAYGEVASHEQKNLKFEAMRGLFKGTKKLYINADYVKDIMEAVGFAKKFNIEHTIIIGGEDSWMITDLLKENKVAVCLNRIHELPSRPEDDVDLPYKRPYLLQKAGVLFCLNYEGDMEAMGSRNLPFTAGTAAAYGLTKEEALMSITLNTAKILGIDDKVGSLETGKDATLFVSEGDALDMRTNNVVLAYIQGKSIDLINHQVLLYEKYKKKYGH